MRAATDWKSASLQSARQTGVEMESHRSIKDLPLTLRGVSKLSRLLSGLLLSLGTGLQNQYVPLKGFDENSPKPGCKTRPNKSHLEIC